MELTLRQERKLSAATMAAITVSSFAEFPNQEDGDRESEILVLSFDGKFLMWKIDNLHFNARFQLDALYSLLQTIIQPFQAILDGVRALVDNGMLWSDEEDTPPGTPDRMIPATAQLVDALPRTLHITEPEEGDDSKCCICRSVYEQGENIMTLPCTHTFHANCVNPWLRTVNGVCPVCRKRL